MYLSHKMGSYVQKVGLNADLGSRQSSVAVLFIWTSSRISVIT